MQIVVEPDRLWFEGEAGDCIVGDVHLLPVIFQRQIRHPLKPGFTGREEMNRAIGLRERRNQECRLGCSPVIADVKAARGSFSFFRGALPPRSAVFHLEVLVHRSLQVVVPGFLHVKWQAVGIETSFAEIFGPRPRSLNSNVL